MVHAAAAAAVVVVVGIPVEDSAPNVHQTHHASFRALMQKLPNSPLCSASIQN